MLNSATLSVVTALKKHDLLGELKDDTREVLQALSTSPSIQAGTQLELETWLPHIAFQPLAPCGVDLACLKGHTAAVHCVAFSPCGTILASGGDDSVIKLWGVSSSNLIATLEGHTGPINSVMFSADGSLLMSTSDDESIRM